MGDGSTTQADGAMECNVTNRTIFCHDNLEILKGINTRCIDLIYLDPPFNKKKVFAAPIGTTAEGADFKDIFTAEDVKDEWVQSIYEDYFSIYRLLEAVKDIEGRTSYNFCYLAYMAIRLIECYRVLKETGSIYLHCDPTMSHYLKLLMDCIFGEKNFRNELVWSYPASPSTTVRDFPRKHDIIIRYAKSNNFIFNRKEISIPYSESSMERIKYPANASTVLAGKEIKLRKEGKIPTSVWQDIQQSYRYKKEHTGYPTQKPLVLLGRIIKASSNKGDIVLDPFCGCATTCVAAEGLNRQWIGIDISIKAYELVQLRIKKEIYESDSGMFASDDLTPKAIDGKMPVVNCKTDPPSRTDGGLPVDEQKYVYVISHKKHKGYYKVGIAGDVKSRLNSYQTGDPHRAYKLEFSLSRVNYRETEQYIHEKYDNKFEWVRGDLQDIIQDIKTFQPSSFQ